MGLHSQPLKRLLKRIRPAGSSDTAFEEPAQEGDHNRVETTRSASDASSNASTTIAQCWYASYNPCQAPDVL